MRVSLRSTRIGLACPTGMHGCRCSHRRVASPSSLLAPLVHDTYTILASNSIQFLVGAVALPSGP